MLNIQTDLVRVYKVNKHMLEVHVEPYFIDRGTQAKT